MKKQQLHEVLAVIITKLSSAMDNTWIGILMKSISGDASVKERMTNKAI